MQGVAVTCPHCNASVEPLRTANGLLLCPLCQNRGAPAPAATWAPPQQPWGPPAQDIYHAAQALLVTQEKEKKTRYAFQYGVCAVVFAGLGLLGVLFGLIGLICGICGLVQGRKLEREALQWPNLAYLAPKAHKAWVLGVIGLAVAPVASAVNLYLVFWQTTMP